MDNTESGSPTEQPVASVESLEERLSFEALLANLSARFVNLPIDRVSDEIEDAQRRIFELLKLDRSTLWQVDVKEPGKLIPDLLTYPR